MITSNRMTNGKSRRPDSTPMVEMELMAIEAAKAARQIFEELGTSCSTRTNDNGDEFPHGGEEPYVTITDVNEVMLLGDQLSRICWGANAKDNRAYYIVGTGHTVTVKPKDENQDVERSKAAVKRVEAFLEKWFDEVDWRNRQLEVSHRLDRHGEVFDTVHYDEDGILRLNFAEPTDLDEDPESEYANIDPESSRSPFIELFGVRRTNDLSYKPVAYFVDGLWYPEMRYVTPMGALPDPERLQAETAIQHRKRNVLGNDPRGLTLYWPVREELIWAKKILANLMRVSGFQAAFGAIRTINTAMGADQTRSWLASQQRGTGSAGDSEKFDFPSPAVVTTSKGISYEFPETGRGAQNHIEVHVSCLRACASGMKLPEFMLTANVSEGNFASTLVSEGPYHKAMQVEQQMMVKEDLRLLHQALRYAAESNVEDLSMSDIDQVRLDIKPPIVQTRNRKEDFDVNKEMWDRGLIPGKEVVANEGKDWDSQQAQRKNELSNELPLPEGSALHGKSGSDPGPLPDSKADPMKEKGVSKGDPSKKLPKKI